MNNFLNFIEEDIEAKKTLISTLPLRTKTNKKNYNEKIDLIKEKYENYKKSVKKYIESKSKNYEVKVIDKRLNKLSDDVATLEHIRFVLNPLNTYYEKMGFDNLIYQINHYADFQFESLNKIINEFLDKFEQAGILLTSKNFDYTYYVNQYMSAFLDVRTKKSSNYSKVSKIFEEIYWLNPNLIEHIEINFRKLIRNYSKIFNKYISDLQRKLKQESGIKNYDDCFLKLKNAYTALNRAEEENISDIVTLARSGKININDYLENSKVRTQVYTELSLDSLNFNDKSEMENFYQSIYKLKSNVVEYSNYREFIPIMLDFKNTYEKFLSADSKQLDLKVKELEKNILEKEKKLSSINKKIFGNRILFFKQVDPEEIKTLKVDSTNLAQEIFKLYKEYDKEYIKSKTIKTLNKSYTISEFLNLYYSFDYFKKEAIKRVFEINDYDELMRIANNFDLFAMNPTNVIMDGTTLFENSDVSKIIVNKYRLAKINISDDDLHTDNIENLLNKIDLLLRIEKIEKSSITVDQIWFLTEVDKIKKDEKIN